MPLSVFTAHLLSRATIAVLLLLFVSDKVDARECHTPLKVALDIGHSPGASGTPSATGKTEYSFNRRFVAELYEAGLQESNLKLVILNTEARDISLLERTEMAKANAADLFVSIHHDSANDKYLRKRMIGGVERIYTYAFRGFSIFVSHENTAYRESLFLARLLGRRFKDGGMMQSLHHAEPIMGEGRKLIDWDLGVYDAPFAVLRNAASPSVLLELGVLVHPDEEALLEQPGYRNKMVGYVLAALNEYCTAASEQARSTKESAAKQ